MYFMYKVSSCFLLGTYGRYDSTTEWYDPNCSWVDAVSWGCNVTLNVTGNATSTDVTSLVLMAVTSVILALIILATIIGES
ncbi:unnamed protein product [Colias eurytheme]|nr:unnamed protein product [Colias eurytheme]